MILKAPSFIEEVPEHKHDWQERLKSWKQNQTS